MVSPYQQLDDFLEFCRGSLDNFKEGIAENYTDIDKIKQAVNYSNLIIDSIEGMANLYKKENCIEFFGDILS